MIGVSTIINSFDYLLGVMLGRWLLQHNDNLSKMLQNSMLSASEAKECAKLTVKVLLEIRCEDDFKLFWANVLQTQGHTRVNPPRLPRKRKPRARLQPNGCDNVAYVRSEFTYARLRTSCAHFWAGT